MLFLGLAMVAGSVAMLFIARPRNGVVVPWLARETTQRAYGFALLLLLTVGTLLMADG